MTSCIWLQEIFLLLLCSTKEVSDHICFSNNNIWYLHGVLHILVAYIKTNSGSINSIFIPEYTSQTKLMKVWHACPRLPNWTKSVINLVVTLLLSRRLKHKNFYSNIWTFSEMPAYGKNLMEKLSFSLAGNYSGFSSLSACDILVL